MAFYDQETDDKLPAQRETLNMNASETLNLTQLVILVTIRHLEFIFIDVTVVVPVELIEYTAEVCFSENKIVKIEQLEQSIQ